MTDNSTVKTKRLDDTIDVLTKELNNDYHWEDNYFRHSELPINISILNNAVEFLKELRQSYWKQIKVGDVFTFVNSGDNSYSKTFYVIAAIHASTIDFLDIYISDARIVCDEKTVSMEYFQKKILDTLAQATEEDVVELFNKTKHKNILRHLFAERTEKINAQDNH